MTKYYITKFKKEIKRKDRRNIAPGCAEEDVSPEHIEAFDSLEKAKEALKEYPAHTQDFFRYVLITEYGITVHEWDEDEEEYVWTGDIVAFSEMDIPVVKADSRDLITTVNSYNEGEKFIYEYEKEHKDEEDFEYLEMVL